MSGRTTEHINDAMNETVAAKEEVATQDEVINKLNLRSHTAYIDADPYVANPYALLGMVLQVRSENGNCPTSLADPDAFFEFTPFPIKRKVDEQSKLREPKLRQSIVVDRQLASNVGFLNYLTAELTADSYFSLMVFDQAAGVIDHHDPEWPKNVREWKDENRELLADSEVCYLFAIAGFVQKNIVRKKYVKFDVSAKGGAYGVNIGGGLATATEEYSLDIKFGISPIILKRPSMISPPGDTLLVAPSNVERTLFSGLTGRRLEEAAVASLLT